MVVEVAVVVVVGWTWTVTSPVALLLAGSVSPLSVIVAVSVKIVPSAAVVGTRPVKVRVATPPGARSPS